MVTSTLEFSSKMLKNVMLIEDLQHNLLSVNALTNKGYTVNFVGDSAEILLKGRLQFVAHKIGKLYETTFHLDKYAFAGLAGKQESNKFFQDLLHFRLGHLNVFDMKKLISRNMVCGLNQTEINTDSKFCESCVYGKQSKTSFPPNKRSRPKRVLELIHTDVCGPMSEPAWDGSRYFVTFMDYFTRASMIYCIERKSDVLEKFKQYVASSNV